MAMIEFGCVVCTTATTTDHMVTTLFKTFKGYCIHKLFRYVCRR